jgi:CheY-like chemotaxis protein
MMNSAELRAAMDLLLHAARGSERRFLVGVGNSGERARIARALLGEGAVVEATSREDALRILADESFDIAFLSADASVSKDTLAAWRELRPFTDVVYLVPSDPAQCAAAFRREVAAVFPLPLPEPEFLLRAHVKRLVTARQSRTRGLLVLNAFMGNRVVLERAHPELAAALTALVADAGLEPAIGVIGGEDFVASFGAGFEEHPPAEYDAVVVELGARALPEAAIQEARDHYPGASLVLVDGAPSSDRLRDCIYGGVRAYLPTSDLGFLGRISASVAARRHAEMVGLELTATLTRFGFAPDGDDSPPKLPSGDLDPRLIADTRTNRPATVVPTGHEVLVVDDEAVVLTVLREALRRGGYRVTTAASAEEAIELMKQRRFDLVLTDKNLPGASGLEVLKAARTLSPAPAIVMITGYSSLDSAVEAMEIGAHDYIEKPIHDVDDLRQRIRRALSRRDEQLARPRLGPAGRAGRVLLVEGEGSRRRLLADYLGRTYDVTAAQDGEEALQKLQAERFDLVLADRHLPGISGLRVIEHAQRLLPHCASVLYTAYPSYDSVKEAFATGIDAYLVRPNDDLKKLAEKVGEALGGRGGILLG